MTSGSFPPPACSGFAGNSDFYGLGIRIGIYLQWISSLLTNVLLPRGISDSLDTNSIFLFAVFVAVANATSLSQEGFHLVEIFVMLQLCFGYLLSVLSVSGLRFTLFSDSNNTHPRFTLQNARDLLNDLPVDFRRLFDIPAIFNSNHPIEVLQSQMNGVRKVVPVLNFRVSPPPGVSISRLEELMLWGLNTLAIYSLLPEILSSDLSPTILSALEPFFWTIDFMNTQARNAIPESPNILVSAHVKLQNDQTSWLGILWRSCIVAGVGIYNVWFWFWGVEHLQNQTCLNYVFLFCKANPLGPARTFFKAVSIFFLIYASVLVLACCYVMLAFLGTTGRSLIINVFIMPYAKLCLLLATRREGGSKRLLDSLDAAHKDFLRWLKLPTIQQLLKGFAYLSSNPKEADVPMEEAPAEANPEPQTGTKHFKVFFIVTTVCTVIWTIIAVELTLSFNSISDVYTIESTGQLIPFVIGIVGLGKTLNSITIDAIKKIYPDWSAINIEVTADNRVIITENENLPLNVEPNPSLDPPVQEDSQQNTGPEKVKGTELP